MSFFEELRSSGGIGERFSKPIRGRDSLIPSLAVFLLVGGQPGIVCSRGHSLRSTARVLFAKSRIEKPFTIRMAGMCKS